MEHEGDVTLLADLAKGGKRIGLLILSGVMRGVYGGAQATALEARGLQHNFRAIVGVSSGAPVALYFAGGAVYRGTNIYHKECTTPSFISASPLRLLKGTTGDVGYLAQIFRGKIGHNPMDLEGMRACAADVFVAVTNPETGKGELINAKTATPDPVAAVHASIAMPVLYRKPVFVNGIRYIDGSVGAPFPALEMFRKWNLDGLIVLANRSRARSGSIKEKMEKLLISLLVPSLSKASHQYQPLYEQGLAETRKNRHLIIWSDEAVGSYARNSSVVKAGQDRARTHMEHLLKGVGV